MSLRRFRTICCGDEFEISPAPFLSKCKICGSLALIEELKKCEGLNCEKEFEPKYSNKQRRCPDCHNKNALYKDGTKNTNRSLARRNNHRLHRRKNSAEQRFWNEHHNDSCVYCGSREKITIDHIRPVAIYRDRNYNNLQILCSSCNTKKGQKEIMSQNSLF